VSSDERIKAVFLEPKELPGDGMDGTKTRQEGSSFNLLRKFPVAKGIRASWHDEEVKTDGDDEWGRCSARDHRVDI
jgi:hypothetical protein